jgi:hypothetical protein
MADRWAVRREPGQLRPTSLFSRFAGRLRTIYANCNLDLSYQVDRSEPLYEHIPAIVEGRARHWVSPSDLTSCLEQNRTEISAKRHGQGQAQVDSTIAPLEPENGVNQRNLAFDTGPSISWDPINLEQVANESQDESGIFEISQSLLDLDSTIIDRVISFDEMMLGNISDT